MCRMPRKPETLSRLCGLASMLLIAASTLVVSHMVFMRYFLGASTIWQTEFVTFALVAATFIGAPYILLTRGHVAVDVVPLMLQTPGRRLLCIAGNLVALVFCGFFLYAAIPWWWETWQSGQTTPSIWKARMWIPYLSVPVGLTVLCLQFIADTFMVASHRSLPFGLSAEEGL